MLSLSTMISPSLVVAEVNGHAVLSPALQPTDSIMPE